MQANTQRHLTEYARQGLRTLCMAKRIIPRKEYQVWLAQHTEAENAMENREDLLAESARMVETDLQLIGESQHSVYTSVYFSTGSQVL